VRTFICCVVLAAIGLSVPPAANGFEGFRLLRLEGRLVKWGDAGLGKGATVSYAYVAAPTSFPDARNCREMAPIDSLAAAHQIAPELLRREVEAAFAMWQAAADIRFLRSDDPSTAGILIGVQATPRGAAFADVKYRQAGDDGGGARSIKRGLVCLNPVQPWETGFNGRASDYDLRYAFAHEIGHAIGLDHPGPSGQLMSFRYEESFRGLRPGDVAGIIALYGARPPVPADETTSVSLQR